MNLINVVALRLAALHPTDQRWLLKQLNTADAMMVKAAMGQLDKLIDLEHGVSDDVLNLITASSQVFERELSELCRIRVQLKRKVQHQRIKAQIRHLLTPIMFDYLGKIGVLENVHTKNSTVVLSTHFEKLYLTKIMATLENTNS